MFAVLSVTVTYSQFFLVNAFFVILFVVITLETFTLVGNEGMR